MTDTTKKLTKREYFAILREAYPQEASNYADVIAFIDHEVDLLTKPRKATAKQNENDLLVDLIVAVADSTPRTVTDFLKEIPQFADFSNQKVSALVRMALERGALERVTVKGRAYFIAK